MQGFPTHSFQNLAPIFFVITLKLFIHRGFQFIQQALLKEKIVTIQLLKLSPWRSRHGIMHFLGYE
ncbi:hypothetical protein [Sphaerospermopsis sp. LEGE 08334]|uniref:hypothetical protein n=1 Tax=Sphaerospermopsis sp. LEGE 08334 TaxID=1828651 RepID=UPI0018811E0E|nr:hypothetical protein [Sphaerospermopsis sp. LEGE 08334]MBE9058285.1 hypothetical protein [Sphaerospermopsis sp. LEGE 08334]